jgi:hypothetical protein
VAVRTVFSWAVDSKLLANNRFTDVRVSVPRGTTTRETKAFRTDELRAILNAASAVTEVTNASTAARHGFRGCAPTPAPALVRSHSLCSATGRPHEPSQVPIRQGPRAPLGVNDRALQPNHAWRHTFKQIADRAGISERMSDSITGHAHKSTGATYGAPTLQDMAGALRKFPRYKLKDV